MTRVLLAYHTDDRYRVPLLRLLERLHEDQRVDVEAEELRPYEYAASMVNALARADYFVPVITNRSDRGWDTSIWAAYSKHFRPRIESVVPVTLDHIWLPYQFFGITPLEVSTLTDAEYDRLLQVIATPRAAILSSFAAALDPASSIVRVAADAEQKLLRYFIAHPAQLRTIDRRDFERLVAQIFREFGYDAEVTARTRDGGRDVIAVRQAEVDVKYLIECKRPDPDHAVSVSAVRELLGVKHDDRATKAILATTTHLSPDAKLFVQRNCWELEAREYDGLMEWLSKIRK